MPPPPPQNSDVEIAIICALPLEARAAKAMFEELVEDLDGPTDGPTDGDDAIYTTGKIGTHKVVLAHMPGMGTNAAAAMASTLKQRFKGIELALLVGICGGVPREKSEKIMLGDIIIGKQVVQYDFGRQYPDQFSRKSNAEDSLGRQSPKIRAFVAKLESAREGLAKKSFDHLSGLRSKPGVDHPIGPPAQRDNLFSPAYWHIHRKPEDCKDGACREGETICEHARHSSCQEVGCDAEELERSSKPKAKPDIHFGRVASGNKVINCGEERDRIAEAENVVAFDMEAAGVWDYLPCVVVKAVCDYADSHKNKKWQEYAVLAAAACTKAILEQWPRKGALQDSMGAPDQVCRVCGCR